MCCWRSHRIALALVHVDCGALAEVIKQQIEKAQARVAAGGGVVENKATDLKRENPEDLVAISFNADKVQQAEKGPQLKSVRLQPCQPPA